jgi:hypothetical protein
MVVLVLVLIFFSLLLPSLDCWIPFLVAVLIACFCFPILLVSLVMKGFA